MIAKYLDASIGHLPAVERVILAEGGPFDGGPRVIQHDYGWWVNVPEFRTDFEDEWTNETPVLATVLRFAREHDCNWVNFDADAEQINGLTFYEDAA